MPLLLRESVLQAIQFDTEASLDTVEVQGELKS